jgi:16S rRNA processing protein RimM
MRLQVKGALRPQAMVNNVTDTLVLVGAVSGARGLTGEVRIKSFTDDPKAIATFGELLSEDRSRRFNIKITGSAKGQLLARIIDVNDRNAADELKGTRFYIPRDILPKAEEDEFYHADLIGLSAVGLDGGKLGEVTAVEDYGAGAFIEVEAEDSFLVPFTKEAVPEVLIGEGRVVINPPDGLFELPEPEEEATNDG